MCGTAELDLALWFGFPGLPSEISQKTTGVAELAQLRLQSHRLHLALKVSSQFLSLLGGHLKAILSDQGLDISPCGHQQGRRSFTSRVHQAALWFGIVSKGAQFSGQALQAQ